MSDAFPVPRTALGRRVRLDLGHPLAPYIKAIFVNTRLNSILEHKLKILAGLLTPLVVVIFRYVQQKRRIAAFLKQLEASKAAAPAVPEGVLDPKGMGSTGFESVRLPTTYEMLRSPEGNMGYKEFFGTVGLCVGASAVMIWKAIVLGLLLARQNDTGLSWAWAKYAIQYPVLCIANVALFDSTGYLKRRIQLKWRRNVTRKLHAVYFSKMRYYRILNEDKDLIVTDPDIRICSDVRDLIGLTAEVVLSLTMAVFFTLLFGSATISNRNWKWSLASPIFFFTAITGLRNIDPQAIYEAYGYMQFNSSRITQLMTRIQLHAERICMLQGEKFELHNLREGLNSMAHFSERICSLSYYRNALDTFFFRSPDSAAAIECTAMMTCTCMGANDIVAGAISAGNGDHLPLNVDQPFPWAGNHMAVMMRDMHGFFNACSGWGSFMQAYMGLKDFHHITGRLKELFYKLDILGTAEGGTASSVFSDEGPVIAFSGVTIQTPTQNVLLKDLTFRVDQGSTLLICGHNGAGKSSIIRALCALWPVPDGKIARPGGHVQAEENKKLHDEVYYLPQKPCNVLGSLSDQLTYPLSIPGGLPEEELRRWLGYVGLEYLVDRKVSAGSVSRVSGNSTEHNDIDWEVLLSMGEQQALSIARLLYHHPRFAILDECTSAVGKELERRLFEVAREIGISCVTITHRPALKEHHARLLQLTGKWEQDGRGWEISQLRDESDLPPTKPRCGSVDEVHSRINAFLERKRKEGRAQASEAESTESMDMAHELEEERSAEYKKKVAKASPVTADAAVRARWPTRLGRIWAVVKLGLPTATERKKAAKKVAIMAVILRARIWIFWYYWRSSTGMLKASFEGDRPQVLAEYLCALGITAISGCLDQGFRTMAEHVSLDLWKTVMDHLPKRVLSNANFLKMMNPPENSRIPEVESPALRLGEVKGVFDALLGQVNDVILPLSQGIAFLPWMITGLGGLSPMLLVFNFLLFRGSQLIAPNFPDIQKRTNTLESRFQVLHTRLRSIAEPVAFSGGGEAERRIVEPHFDELLEHYERSSRQETAYNMMVTAFTDYRQMPVWTQRLASMRYAMFNNPVHPDGIAGSTIVSNFLFDRTIQYPQVAVQKIVKLTEASGRIDGQCARILELVAACDAIDEEPKPNWEAPPAGSSSISVTGLDLVTRRGVCLAKGLDFKVEAGIPMVCTGPNATGKSLLGSVLLGLWNGEGAKASVSVPGATGLRPPLGTIMPAPQQIYLPGGCLFDQCCYPVPTCGPAGPPTEMRVRNTESEITQAGLLGLFAPFGCVNVFEVNSNGTTGSASKEHALHFVSKDGAIYAAARPMYLIIGGKEVKIYFTEKEPNSEGRVLPDLVRMRQCLRAVGIDHILTREEAGWVTQKEWSDALSGGEQQRLCVARVLYHKPTFGLLDECTSMVAADAEQELYRMLFRDWGITPLTLTQRMFMPEFYKRELRLGLRSKAGWEVASMEDNMHPVAG